MERHRQTFRRRHMNHTSKLPNLNQNNSIRPIIDYADVDFEAIAVNPRQDDKEDKQNRTQDANKRSVFDRLGEKPNQLLSQRVGQITVNQSITDFREISNDCQDNNLFETRCESSVAHKTTHRNHRIDTNKRHPDVPTEHISSQGKKNESGKRKGQSHSTDSIWETKISTSNIERHVESSKKYQKNAHDHNEGTRNKHTLNRKKTYERSNSTNNRSREPLPSPRRRKRSSSSNNRNRSIDNRDRPDYSYDRQSSLQPTLYKRSRTKSPQNTDYRGQFSLTNNLEHERKQTSSPHVDHRTVRQHRYACIKTDFHLSHLPERSRSENNRSREPFRSPRRHERSSYSNDRNRSVRVRVRQDNSVDKQSSLQPTIYKRSRTKSPQNTDYRGQFSLTNNLEHERRQTSSPHVDHRTVRHHRYACIKTDFHLSHLPERSRSENNRSREPFRSPRRHERSSYSNDRNRSVRVRVRQDNSVDKQRSLQKNIYKRSGTKSPQNTEYIGQSSPINNLEQERRHTSSPHVDHRSTRQQSYLCLNTDFYLPQSNFDTNAEHDTNNHLIHQKESRHEDTGHEESLTIYEKTCKTVQNEDTHSNTYDSSKPSLIVNQRRNCQHRYQSGLNVKSRAQNTRQIYNGNKIFTKKSQTGFEACDQKIDVAKLSKMDTDSLAAYMSTCSRELDTFLFKHEVIEQMSLFLHVMSKLCESNHYSLVQKSLNPLKERKFFDRKDIKDIICKLRLQFDQEHIYILTNLLVLMKGLVYHVNSGPSDLMQPLDSLERCVQEKVENKNQQRDLESLIKEIREKWNPKITPQTENKLFTLSILPNLIEIESCESSIIDHEYETEEGYLRRLFMVHRQDFIRPLCRGLVSLKDSIYEDPDCLEKRWRHDDIRVYTNITFLTRCCNEQNGLTWKISFDIAPYSRINWNTRKLLTFGSLVCLTNRTFTILQYATVAERNANDLQNGIFEIKFIEDIGYASTILQQSDILLIESQAFFPSYFHTLHSLKCMHSEIFIAENRLPFGKQLLNKGNSIERDVPEYFESPKYLYEGFDISCLNSEFQVYNIDITSESNWPDADFFKLDESQYKAFLTSMKSKLALIQGPPGTGKTVVGLKIAELLLKNEHIWRQQETQGPMLLLSYTNHALDQFLVDISKRFRETDATDIVRLGSRSETEVLRKYNLTTKRKIFNYSKKEQSASVGVEADTNNESSDELNVMASNARANLKTRIKEHENLKKLKEEIQTGIVHQDWLHYIANVITNTQYRALQNEDSLIRWLNVESLSQQVGSKQHKYWSNSYEEEDFDYLDEEETWYDDQSVDSDKEGIQTLNKDLQIHLDIEKLEMVVSSRIVFGKEKSQTKPWFWKKYDNNEKKCFIKKIEEKLCCTKIMAIEKADSVSNLWNIDNEEERWQLYKHWVHQSLIPINKEIQDCENSYKRAQERYEEIQHIADINILKRAKLVACTTTRAARDIEILKRVSPSIVLLEEAAEIPEHHVVACLTSSCQQLIMIGDHQQLRPSYNDYKTALQHKINISLFERLIRERFPYKQLEYQHRMRPIISQLLVPHIYRTLQDDHSVLKYENVKGIHSNLFFLSHSVFEDREREELSRSHKNTFEALFICNLYKYLRMQGYPSSKITVLSTYLDQVRLLRELIRPIEDEFSKKDSYIDGIVNCLAVSNNHDKTSNEMTVRVKAVDNYQGEENEIILLSLVRSNKENKIGYLSEANRVCVALSRAKIGLYAIGNFELLKAKSKLWNNIVNDAEKRQCFGTTLQLTCQKHKNSTDISNPDDFDRVADGGCQKSCSERRKCGHLCLRKCHVDDPDHSDNCSKQCNREVCKLGHRCSKTCHFPYSCGKCNEMVEKTIPECQHKQQMPCHLDPDSTSCNEQCQAIISCGHRCQKHCTDPCNTEDDCQELITVDARCRHSVQVACCTKYDPPCRMECSGILDCGHKCQGTCSDCSQGRLHVPCKKKCNRNLVCGHICKESCNYRCPPCKQKCDRQCIHGDTCKSRCGDSCIQCIELCKWDCKAECPNRFKCEQLCMEPCKRQKCNTLCNRRLDCGHKCSGLFCESSKCICKVCENLTEILFGYEDEANAMFIRLEDCKCVLEVNGLDKYISNVLDNPSDESCTDLHSKRFATKQLLTKYEIDIPIDIFTKLWNKVKHTRSIDILNTLIFINSKQNFLNKKKEIPFPDNIQKHLLKLESIEVMEDEELSLIRQDTEEVSSRIIGLTLKEKQMIKRAMNNEFMGSGHWYKCKNGHYYSIGECGMPVEQIKCPQCGVPIGGVDHILTDDNERAMDFENL
ncbi:LOW QUALITY PROTEIN: NFX1-type zinc finger-containing protein 1-like [Mytilus edulis]|uniref:LOW QUALITY PROTEIN: NFX1-type zinc finger-containing protein 1-like n=1 Tax=Mytilus edulis TaxID=6550 RepID=UPI0039EE1612